MSISDHGARNGDVSREPFPVQAKEASSKVNGVDTIVSLRSFTDKIMITIIQAGRLSQWIQVPLSTASPTSVETALPVFTDDLLPAAHLSPKTLLGGGGEQRETLGHLYATQLASMISTRNPEETRTIVVGLGLQSVDSTREAFYDMVQLFVKVL